RVLSDPLAKFTNGHIFPHAAKGWPRAKQDELFANLATNHSEIFEGMCAAGCVERGSRAFDFDHVSNHLLLCDQCNRDVDVKFELDTVETQAERVSLLWRWRQKVRTTPPAEQMVSRLGICTDQNRLTDYHIALMKGSKAEAVALRVMALRDA